MKGSSLIGALVGGFVGAVIWLVAIAIDGSPLGVFALIVGAGVAAGAILFNSTPGAAIPAAIMTLFLCVLAKFAGIPLALDLMRSNVKSEFEMKQYDMFMADAEVLSRSGPAEYEEYIKNRSPYDADRSGDLSSNEREVFNRFWAPRLKQWAATPPTFETWKPAITEEWHKEAGELKDAKSLATDFFAPVQLLFLLLAVVGAHQAVFRISLEEARLRKKGTGKVQAGVFDLNEDIGSGVDIKVAAPGQSARKPATPDQKPAARKDPPKKEAPKDDKTRFEPKPPSMKPAPKQQDRPPGM